MKRSPGFKSALTGGAGSRRVADRPFVAAAESDVPAAEVASPHGHDFGALATPAASQPIQRTKWTWDGSTWTPDSPTTNPAPTFKGKVFNQEHDDGLGGGIVDETVYTTPDGHEGKHLKYKGKPKKWLKKKTKTGTAATFVGTWASNYNAKLVLVINAATSANPQANFVNCGTTVGYDAGEETTWVELYYGGSIGSHMRPKASSQVSGNTTDLT